MTSMAMVLKAADFAAKKHRDQRRKDAEGTPYINHPIGVANIIINEGLYQLRLYSLKYVFPIFLILQEELMTL